jgi:hypothetical protein
LAIGAVDFSSTAVAVQILFISVDVSTTSTASLISAISITDPALMDPTLFIVDLYHSHHYGEVEQVEQLRLVLFSASPSHHFLSAS